MWVQFPLRVPATFQPLYKGERIMDRESVGPIVMTVMLAPFVILFVLFIISHIILYGSFILGRLIGRNVLGAESYYRAYRIRCYREKREEKERHKQAQADWEDYVRRRAEAEKAGTLEPASWLRQGSCRCDCKNCQDHSDTDFFMCY